MFIKWQKCESSVVTIANMNGISLTGQVGRRNVLSVKAKIFTGHKRIGVTQGQAGGEAVVPGTGDTESSQQ